MTQIWTVKIRKSVKKEFPRDQLMQELHEIRVRLSKKYKPAKIGGIFRVGQPVIKEKLKAR